MSQALEKISTLSLILLMTGAIDSIRNLPTTALFGSTLVFFFILGAIFFLIPVALISAELTSTRPSLEGGIYDWVRLSLGPKFAFITIWLQWINTVVWFPTILSFIAATAAYLFKPELAANKYYLVSSILIVFWGLTFLNLKGIKTSAKFASICTVLGMILPMALIIVMALYWLLMQKPIAIDLSFHALIPDLKNVNSWVSLTAIMTAFLGMELAAVHVKNIHKPQKNFPKAMFFSVILILATMILGSLAIAIVLPAKDINLVAGVMQAFDNFFMAYHITFFEPVLVLFLVVGSLGGLINWIISPAKGLLQAANHGYLPKFMCKKNEHQVATNILLIQAIAVTLLCSAFLLVPSINGIYWLFTDLSTELYLFMYALMFIAAFILKNKDGSKPNGYRVPGGKTGYYVVCLMGLIGALTAIVIGFIPPENTFSSSRYFSLIFAIGLVVMTMPAFIIIALKKPLKD